MVTRVLITSINPVKVQASKDAFFPFFKDTYFSQINVDTGDLKSQPIGEKETYTYSRKRVEYGRETEANFDFYVGIEGGIVVNPQNHKRIVVYSSVGNSRFIETVRGCEIPLPSQWFNDLVEQNHKELGDLMDELSGVQNIKQKEGAIGFLSQNVVKRYDILKQSVIMALIPFLNPSIFNL
ncbi:MAG: DUF84 family protein [Candidatus Hodarchaeales archaeon]|jgi:inosine/xanthosine triphosphatase